ncbi:MAG TPA: phosphatase PAP2 family protein [Gaiellaceae bacterium]
MTTVVAAGRRVLPRGYAHFVGQVVIWLGFYFSYLAVRGVADRDPTKAFVNGLNVIDFEQRTLHHLFEQTAQRIVDSSHILLTAAAWTYWNSELTVLCITLLFIYLRRHEWFSRFRNTVLLANVIGLLGYVVMPTAPPWMYPGLFTDGVNHSTGLVNAMANPYAAMPSLHAADALIVGIFLFRACRHRWAKALWALWPAWVWFCVMATANHYLLDVLAGILVALIALKTVSWLSTYRKRAIVAA